ncbi:MAG: NADH-ubiquinone oxidoreductase [Acetobacteraceae bacterium]|nr:NADH-ubiquinone oxidoreductase [Acetobacteraceae bacterium]
MQSGSVHVVGASGRSGVAVCRALQAAGTPVIPVVRNRARWTATGLGGEPRIADLTAPAALRLVLGDASRIVCCAHARHTAALLAASPPAARYVLLGSTRKFTRWPDAHGLGVQAGEAAFTASGQAGVMLHPTMIYGAQGENNVQRLAALLRRLPVVPLPGGGRALVQPIHQDDLTLLVMRAVERDWRGPETLVVAGPAPVSYAAFVRAVASAAGLPPPRFLAVPGGLLRLAAAATAIVPGVPTVRPAEVRRLLEDKSFDIGPMVATLGVHPVGLEEGLARTFRRAAPSCIPA